MLVWLALAVVLSLAALVVVILLVRGIGSPNRGISLGGERSLPPAPSVTGMTTRCPRCQKVFTRVEVDALRAGALACPLGQYRYCPVHPVYVNAGN